MITVLQSSFTFMVSTIISMSYNPQICIFNYAHSRNFQINTSYTVPLRCLTDLKFSIYPLEDMAIHSSIFAWEIPGTEEPGGLQSMGLQRVGHDWVTEYTPIYTLAMQYGM